MRVVQLANFITPTSGGIRTTLNSLAEGYGAHGIDVARIQPGASAGITVHGKTHIFTLPGLPVPGSGGYRVLLDRRHLVDLLTCLAPDRLEVSDRFTLTWLGPWARARGIPTTLLLHERLAAIAGAWLPRSVAQQADRLDRRLPGRFDHVVAASQFAAGPLWGAPNVHVVPFGVDTEVFHPAAANGAIPPGAWIDADLRMIALGRLSRERRPELALSALEGLRRAGLDARLLVVGTGPMEQRLRAMGQGSPVTFVGHIADRRRVAGLLAHADVALATCPIETFGLAALEALASGTPIVGVAGGALRELVPPSVGCLVEPDGHAMAAAAQRMLGRRLHESATAARRHALQYTWDRTVEAMLEVHGIESSMIREPALIA
jgi:alpha-1,6-mannosyltransferase